MVQATRRQFDHAARRRSRDGYATSTDFAGHAGATASRSARRCLLLCATFLLAQFRGNVSTSIRPMLT
jgi:hypothetical protein